MRQSFSIMSDMMYDLATLIAMARDLKYFFRSDIVFWQLSDAGPFQKRFPKLTVAGLLFCQHKRSVLQGTLPPEKQPELEQVQTQVRRSLSIWYSNVERKAVLEIGGRLHSWEWYLSDCSEDPRDCSEHYTTEVYARVYIHFLLQLLGNKTISERARAKVDGADAKLRAVFVAGAFVWDSDLRAAFPSKEYWFLYGQPGIL